MAEAAVTRYWCHECEQVIDEAMEEDIKCPFCDGGFVEEMSGEDFEGVTDQRPERGLLLWAPALLGMLDSPSMQSRARRDEEEEDLDREFEDFLRRRRRRSAVRRLLESIRDDLRDDPDELGSETRGRERERESAILINAFNQAVILQGSSFDSDESQGDQGNSSNVGASLEDYFLGPGLDLLLQHLAENDPSRYGTPPAKKEAVDALPTVKIEEAMSCSVCLDDFELGSEAKQMPCKHKFHASCILQWLELHSSCPVCRFELPADETKDLNELSNSNRTESSHE